MPTIRAVYLPEPGQEESIMLIEAKHQPITLQDLNGCKGSVHEIGKAWSFVISVNGSGCHAIWQDPQYRMHPAKLRFDEPIALGSHIERTDHGVSRDDDYRIEAIT